MSKITLALSTSAISEAFKCPHAWAIRYRENLSKADQITTALDEGSLIHSMFEVYYTLRAANPLESIFEHSKAMVEIFTKHELYTKFGVSTERWQFIVVRFTQYLAKYSLSDLMPVVNSGVAAVEVGFSKIIYEDSKYLFLVESRLDLIIKLADEMLWVDHKSQGQAGRLYPYCSQFLTYAWATGFNKGLVNYFRTAATYNDNNTFVKDLITFPKWMVDEWEEKLIKLFFQLAYVLDSHGMDANSEKFERNRASCAGAFEKTPCQFTPVCETGSLEMRQSIKSFNFIKNPPRRSWELR